MAEQKFYPSECGWCGTKYALTRNTEVEDPHACWICGRKEVRRTPFPKADAKKEEVAVIAPPAKTTPVAMQSKLEEARTVVIRPAVTKVEPKVEIATAEIKKEEEKSEEASTLRGLHAEGDDGRSFRSGRNITDAPFGSGRRSGKPKIVRARDHKCGCCGEMFTGQGIGIHEPFCYDQHGKEYTGKRRASPKCVQR